MKKLLALLFLFSALPLFGQGTSFPVFNRQGWTMAGAVVGTCQGPANPGTATLYCTSPVTTYTDWTLVVPCTQVTTIPNPPGPPLGPVSGVGCTNPGLTDSHGNATIFAANGFYWALVSGYQVVPQTFPFSIGGGGGGGGGNPCGTTYDVQLNINNAFGCDTGVYIEIPAAGGTPSTTYNTVFSANKQLDVSDSANTGVVDIGHSTGTVVDGHFQMSLSPTFVAPGYGIDWPDAAPASGSSLTATGSVDGSGRYLTHWASAVAGLVSLENLPYIYTDYPCNSPANCADLAPIQVPYAANNFYAGPRTGTGVVGYLTNTVTATDNTGTATNATFTFPYPTRAGDPLVLIINNNGGVPTAPTDSCGNTWLATANGHAWYVASAVVCNHANVVTQPLGGTGSYIIGGGEVSGGGVLDVQSSAGSCGALSGSTYPITFTSLTTTAADTLVTLLVQGGAAQTGLGVYAGTNNFLVDAQSNYDGGGGLGDSWSIVMGWQPALNIGANNTTMNYTYTGSSNICSAAGGVTLAFKPSSTNNPANPVARQIYIDDLEPNVLPTPGDGQTIVWDAIYGIYKNLIFGSGLTYSASTHTLSVTSAGSVAFSGISSGTNTTAAMLVGTGASLAPTGTGTISANQVNGASIPVSATPVCTNGSSQLASCAATYATVVCSGTITFNPGATSSNTCSAAATGTCTGAATTDNIMVDFNADPTATTGYVPGAMGTIIKYPTANTVNVKYCNNTTNSITPSSVTLNYRVVR